MQIHVTVFAHERGIEVRVSEDIELQAAPTIRDMTELLETLSTAIRKWRISRV